MIRNIFRLVGNGIKLIFTAVYDPKYDERYVAVHGITLSQKIGNELKQKAENEKRKPNP
jgi:DNA-binding Lrp family transcriptional regulator